MKLLRILIVCCLVLAWSAPALADPFADGRAAARRGDWSQAIRLFTTDIKSGTNSPHNLAVVHNNRGNAYLKKNDLTLAMADFNRAIELDPKHANPYYNRSLAWERRGDKARAIADIKRYIALKPKDPDGPSRLAKLQGSSGASTTTSRPNLNTNAAQGQNAVRLNDEGWKLFKAGKRKEALAKFNRAIELDPKFALAYNNRGIVHKRSGRIDQAIADYSRSISLGNNQRAAAFAHFNRALIYETQKKWSLAIADAKKFMAMMSKDPDGPKLLARLQKKAGITSTGAAANSAAGSSSSNTNVNSSESSRKTAIRLNGEGWKLIKAGKLKEALVKLNRAIELDPKFALAYNNRGIVHKRSGRINLAIADYSRSISLGNNHRAAAFAHFNRALIYESQKKWSLAIADAKKFMAMMPKDPDGPKLLAKLQKKAGMTSTGAATTTPTTMAAPPTTRRPVAEPSARDLNKKGWKLYKAKKYDEAIGYFNRAIKLKPDYAVAYHNRGLAYRKKGMYERAIADYDKVLALKPTIAVVYYNRSIAYEKAGQMDRALADIKKYVKMAPDDPDGPQRLRALEHKMGQPK